MHCTESSSSTDAAEDKPKWAHSSSPDVATSTALRWTRPLARAQHFEDVVGEERGHGGAVLVDGLEDLDEDLQRGDGRRPLLGLVRDHRRQVLVRVPGILPKNGRGTSYPLLNKMMRLVDLFKYLFSPPGLVASLCGMLTPLALDREEERDEGVLQLLFVLELITH